MSINSKKKGASGERWKPIKNYETRYEISNYGRVKSLAKYNRKSDIILTPTANVRDGRLSVCLCKDTKTRQRISVHRLVAQAFIPNPNNYEEINHKDENPKNNNADNLEWCTRKYNMNYGTLPKRINEKNKKAVVGRNEHMQIKLNYIREGQKYGYDSRGILKSIKTGKLYKGLIWRYCDGNK